MKVLSAIGLALLLAAPAHAQREAVSPDLSPEIAGQVFARTVAEICVPAVSGDGIGALSAAQAETLRQTLDAETRKQAGAEPGETVWDVLDGKGVVTVREKPGQCAVSVYGPPVDSTMTALFSTAPEGSAARAIISKKSGPASMEAYATVNGRQITIRAEGSEPGSPGHQSKFSVVTATVSRGQ